MKRNDDDLNLRAAFRDEPDACHAALMDAARSVREEKGPVKRFSMKTVVIAALVAAAMLTTAFAAGDILGWTDYFDWWGIHTTPQMQTAMQMEPKTYTLGPVNFTVQEAVADNRLAMISTTVSTADGSPALLGMFADDPVGAYGDRSRVLMNALGLEDKSLMFSEAAAQKGVPMYSIRATIEVDEAHHGGECMEDIFWNAQGDAVYVSSHSLKAGNVGKELPITIFLRVAQHDESGEEIQKWTARETLTIPVGQKLAEKTYQPDAPFTVNGASLESIHAELYVTGAYLTCSWRMPDGLAYDEENFSMWDYHSDGLLFADGTFNVFEPGVSLTGSYDPAAWPIVTVEQMINVDALPEVIRVSGGTADVQYK